MKQEKPKIAIMGYGKMGKCIEKMAQIDNFIITDIFDIDNKINENKKYEFDVAIDFSTPDSVVENIKILTKLKKNIVVGTTGWYDQLKEIENECRKNGNGIVWASNFSIGIQIFLDLVKRASAIINNFDNYDIFISEIHHNKKLDSPSGTAKSIADVIIANNKTKTKSTNEVLNRQILPNELHIASLRGGSIYGVHNVYIDSDEDTIKIEHTAKNRNGLAKGALLAAQWIFNKKGFYCFNDILNEIFNI